MSFLTKKPFKDRLKDTGFLIKHSFTVVGMDKDIKTPTIRMIILSVIISTLIWGSITLFFSGSFVFVGIIALFLALFVLIPFRFFYDVRQKADQSWIVFNTISGRDISYADAHAHTKSESGKLVLIGLIDLIVKYVSNNQGQKKGIVSVFILGVLAEVWDLLSHYMLPAVVIEQKPLKELVPEIKALRANVPATLAGVFGIDFVGNVVRTVFLSVSSLFFLLSLGIGVVIGLGTDVTVVSFAGVTFSWVPVILFLYIMGVLGVVIDKVVESIKVIYFTVFYTSITRPTSILESMRSDLTNYLLFSDASSSEVPDQYVSQLSSYISSFLASGRSEAEVRTLLLSKGHSESSIKKALELTKK